MPTASTPQTRPQRGDELELTIDALAFGGAGVARADGYVVFVTGAVPGDRVRAVITKRKRAYGEARTLEMMLRQALRPPRIMTRGARPLFSVLVIAGVAPDLRALISVLRTENASARGVSLLERLITHGDSPLYGREAAVLREELRRVRSGLGE